MLTVFRGKLSPMLRVLATAAAVALSVGGVGGAAIAAPHPGSSAPPPLAAPASGIVFAGVDDFTFESYEADFHLDTDENGRSVLRTVETFVAVFPEIDQNRGMRRAIPANYQGVPTDVRVISITDENGNPRPMEVESDDDGFILATSRAGDFVHGRQIYVFTYEQHNVTRYFENTDAQEFYWDTNGTGWAQPFGEVTARVHVPDHLASSLTGSSACYFGYAGSTDQCELERVDAAGETIFEASVPDIPRGANVTVAIGFAPGTFVPRDESYFASPLGFVQAIAAALAVLGGVLAIIARRTRLADGKGRPTIIAEYAPPKGLDLIVAAVLLGRTERAAAAQFIDFAVRRRVRIIEQEQSGFFSSKKTYLLQLLDPSGLEHGALRLAQALFGFQLQPGTGYHMTGSDTRLSTTVRGVISAAKKQAVAEGYRKTGTASAAVWPFLLAVGGLITSFVIGILLFESALGGWIPGLAIGVAVLSAIIVFACVFRSPLTDKGAEVRDHLKGLDLYIRLAEADRMRVLQSPQGAERTPVSTTEPGEVLKLYEKLLPYAVLFKHEKEWAQELGRFYVEESPDWYSGSGAFNAAIFATSISALSTSVASSYSGSSSSSSSGGSGGGGSSGGGGGGGGGGGV